MLDHLYAKPYERLDCHTDRVLYATLALRERYEPALQLGEAFWADAILTALFHDFGKATGNFQETMERARKSQKPDFQRHLRHEFISGMLLAFHTLFSDRQRKDIEPNLAQLLAVFSHHKTLDNELFSDQSKLPFVLRPEDATAFFQYCQVRINEFALSKANFTDKLEDSANSIIQICSGKLNPLMADKEDAFSLIWNEVSKKGKFTFRNTYILHKAVLNIADWSASGHRDLERPLQYTPNELKQKLQKRTKGRFSDWRVFQRDSIVPGHVLAIAPTGSGKTEASLLWASQREGWEKILFLLPTRVTANALYRRLNEYFGETDELQPEPYTAVVHSSAKMFRQDLDKNYDELSYYRESGFFKAVTVATVDQMLTQGFNLGWWEMKTFHLTKARVIIDEVHAYQPYTLGLLVASIEYLRKYWQTRFYVMTATMPTQLRNILADALGGKGNISIRQDQELLNAARNTYRIVEKSVDELAEEIRQRVKAGQKVLLVVNTVDEAIRLFDAFDDLAMARMVYHSRFTVQDRNEKEKEILTQEEDRADNGFLLIATQVVEVSLDIDYDYLYTENAPIDAIIQRAGRVNRKRGKERTEVIVFSHREVSQKIYEEPKKSGPPPYPVLQKTWETLTQHNGQRLSEAQLLQLVDNVYKGWAIAEDDSFKDAKLKYAQIQADTLQFVQDNNNNDEQAYTREGLDTVSVIPIQFQTRMVGKSAREKSKFEVTIRKKRYLTAHSYGQITKDNDHDWIRYLDCIYSFEKGLEFKEKENHAGLTHNY